MARWECIVCGLVYDEKEGWPDDGIPAGTKWADVPEDWLCPDCGVGKEDFELLDDDDIVSAPHDVNEAGIVIIGTGLAAYHFAREFRRLNKTKKLTLISRDAGRFYSKPMLSTGFSKNKTADDLAMNSAAAMAEQLDATIMNFTEVTAIDSDSKLLHLKNGSNIAYAQLVIAWGADTITPPLQGDAADEVLSINDLMDYANFRQIISARGVKKIAIIGAGLIGCEFTNDLLNGGFSVDTIDPLATCLPTLLPETAGKAVEAALSEQGATFHFGALVTAVDHSGSQYTLTLNNGTTIQADCVISAVGVRPRTQLAKESHIACERGVITDTYLRTNKPDIYALGDCAQVNGHVLFYVAPLMACARALAKTLDGESTPVSYPAMPVTIKTPSCPVVVSPPAKDARGEWHITQEGNSVQAEFRDAQGHLLGFALTGDKIAQKNSLQKELPNIF